MEKFLPQTKEAWQKEAEEFVRIAGAIILICFLIGLTIYLINDHKIRETEKEQMEIKNKLNDFVDLGKYLNNDEICLNLTGGITNDKREG